MIFLFKQPGLALIRRNQKYIVVRSIPSLMRRRMARLQRSSRQRCPRPILFSPHGPFGTTGQGSPASRQKAPGLLPGRFYQKTILLMKGVWWAYGMKAREGSGSVIIREARFPGVIEPRVSSTPIA